MQTGQLTERELSLGSHTHVVSTQLLTGSGDWTFNFRHACDIRVVGGACASRGCMYLETIRLSCVYTLVNV